MKFENYDKLKTVLMERNENPIRCEYCGEKHAWFEGTLPAPNHKVYYFYHCRSHCCNTHTIILKDEQKWSINAFWDLVFKNAPKIVFQGKILWVRTEQIISNIINLWSCDFKHPYNHREKKLSGEPNEQGQ